MRVRTGSVAPVPIGNPRSVQAREVPMRQPRNGEKRETDPGKNGKTGLSPEVWEAICKALPGVIRAVAELVKVLGH
jgi:hypothetical protein